MLKTSALEILRTLDKDELKRFEAFLMSPYYNTRNNVIYLFELIKKYVPEFKSEQLDKEILWKKLFPEKDYNYGTMKNIIYDFTRLIERFLETESFAEDDIQRMNHLLLKLQDKKLYGMFESKYKSYEKNHFKPSKYYYTYFNDYFLLMRRKFEMEAYNMKLHTKNIATDLSKLMILDFMAKFSNNYNNYYIEITEYNEKPKDEIIKKFSDAVFNNQELEDFFVEMSKRNDKDYKSAIIFFKMMKCYLNPGSIVYYNDFKNTLYENDKYVSEGALRGHYASLGSAIDNCKDVSGINKSKELFDVITHMSAKNIFLSEAGRNVPTLYLLAVKLAGNLKQPAFIEMAIRDYLPKTDEDLQENFMIYSTAYLHSARNEFDKALEYVNKIQIDTFQLKYSLKNLQIMISYEKNDYDMFLYLNDTQKHFLSKNKSVTESYKNSNMKFLNYVNSLFKLRESGDKHKASFTEKTLREDNVVNKYWILDKLDELQL